jgi:tripartite-type tricarboxylate transporter receptor subunit TctC
MKRLLFATSLLLLVAAELPAQENFYQGKTIQVLVGFIVGDAYDLWPRLVTRYMSKYIPGNPNFVIQNKPGAGSLIAANQLYALAKPDGLTIGAIGRGLYLDQLVGRKEVQFDWSKFLWIGSPEQSNGLLYMRADTPYKDIEAVRQASDPPKCGTTGTSGTGYYMPKLLEETTGAKFAMVSGYQGGGDIDLAVERGEIQCRALSVATFFTREPFHTWRKKSFVRVLIQTGRRRDERLPDVPTLNELMERYKASRLARGLATAVLANETVGRPLVAPPGVPPERIKLLREAFVKAVTDPELIGEAKKKNLDLDATNGEELEALAKEVIAQPPEVVERMTKLLGK